MPVASIAGTFLSRRIRTFDFASTVLNGSLKSEVWQYSASAHAAKYDEYLYIDKDIYIMFIYC